MRCEYMKFLQHIESLRPPSKFTGDSKCFQTWATDLIEYFQSKKKDFYKSTDCGLVVFAQSRIDRSPASLIHQLTLSGQEFPSLYELLKFMYQTYGIEYLYSYYERKFNAMKRPSGLDLCQNLAIFRAQIAPCKDILGWTNRATISKFLTKLPLWTQLDLATLRYDNDNYNEFLEELDDYFRRNYTSRQLLAESKKSLLNENKVPITDKNNYNKLSPDTASPALKSNYPTSSGSSIDLELKAARKEQLREQDR
ncbi:hypothetical protein K3495_g13586 [Podosphaera aphanis]|nr:hypothetical protein K3495_g13586 [Podosphaera aphanis]